MVVKESPDFVKWIRQLRDREGRNAVLVRIGRLIDGHAGDAAPVGEGVSELRIHKSPGYRVYFQRRGDTLLLLLCGGDKDSQDRDIVKAKQIAATWEE